MAEWLKVNNLALNIDKTSCMDVYRHSQVRKPNGSDVKWAECSFIIETAWAFSHLANRCLESSRFESCIQQSKTICLLSIGTSLACARASKLTTTNMYVARSRCERQTGVKSIGLNAHSSYGRAVEFKFLAWSLIAQSVCEWAFNILTTRCLESSRFESCIQQRK